MIYYTLYTKSPCKYLTIDLKPFFTLVSYNNAGAIRANEDMPITKQDAQHVSLIFSDRSFVRFSSTPPGVDQNQLITNLQFASMFLDNAIGWFIIDEVDMLRCGT